MDIGANSVLGTNDLLGTKAPWANSVLGTNDVLGTKAPWANSVLGTNGGCTEDERFTGGEQCTGEEEYRGKGSGSLQYVTK